MVKLSFRQSNKDKFSDERLRDIFETIALKESKRGNNHAEYDLKFLKERVASGENVENLIPDTFALFKQVALANGLKVNEEHFRSALAMLDGVAVELLFEKDRLIVIGLLVLYYSIVGQKSHIFSASINHSKIAYDVLSPIYNQIGLKNVLHISQSSSWWQSQNWAVVFSAFELAIQSDIRCIHELRSDILAAYGKKEVVFLNNLDDQLITNAGNYYYIYQEEEESLEFFREISRFVEGLSEVGYQVDGTNRKVSLTNTGEFLAAKFFGIGNIRLPEHSRLLYFIETALYARQYLKEGTDYKIRDNEIVLLDVETGQVKEGYIYSKGLHQILEARHGVKEFYKTKKDLIKILAEDFITQYQTVHVISSQAIFWAESYNFLYNQKKDELPKRLVKGQRSLPDFFVGSLQSAYEHLKNDIRRLRENTVVVCCETNQMVQELEAYLMVEGVMFQSLTDVDLKSLLPLDLRGRCFVGQSRELRDGLLKLFGTQQFMSSILVLDSRYQATDGLLKEVAVGQDRELEFRRYIVSPNKLGDIGENRFIQSQSEKKFKKTHQTELFRHNQFSRQFSCITNENISARCRIKHSQSDSRIYLKQLLKDISAHAKIHLDTLDEHLIALVPSNILCIDKEEKLSRSLYQWLLELVENKKESSKSYPQNLLINFLKELLMNMSYRRQQLEWLMEDKKLSLKEYEEALALECKSVLRLEQSKFLRKLLESHSQANRSTLTYEEKSFKNGDCYRGFVSTQGVLSGAGTYIQVGGQSYSGLFKDGKFSGVGTVTTSAGEKLFGIWQNGRLKKPMLEQEMLANQVTECLTFIKNSSYEGQAIGSVYNGFGRLTWSDQSVYEGQWKDGKRHGTGTMVFSNNAIYEGEWLEDNYSGKGKMIYSDGAIYDGEWLEGNYSGRGKMTYSDGTVYDGEWLEGKYSGKGKYTWPNGSYYQGEFLVGLFHGTGKKSDADGRIIQEGYFTKGKFARTISSFDGKSDTKTVKIDVTFPFLSIEDNLS